MTDSTMYVVCTFCGQSNWISSPQVVSSADWFTRRRDNLQTEWFMDYSTSQFHI